MSENERSISLDAEKFNQFIQCISILRDLCNDIDIRDGIVRQRSNDRTVIFEMDMTSLISNLSIPITNIKQKFDLFKMYSNEEVTILLDDTKFSITDNYSTINFNKPTLEYMDNKYITNEELTSIFELFDDDMILKIDISKTISDRLKVISQSFNVNSVQIFFNGDKGILSSSNQAKDQNAKLIDNIVLNKEIDKSITNINITPFIIGHDSNIDFSVYNDKENQLINCSKANIGEVNISIYGRSIIISGE